MINSFEDFQDYYEQYGKCPGQINKPNHKMNEKELKTRYIKYCKQQVKNKEKNNIDYKWLDVVAKITKRDLTSCRLLSILSIEEKQKLYECTPITLLKQLDVAHVIARSNSKKLYYDERNLVLLSRACHSRIDSYTNPIDGTPITKEERNNWWIRIIGKDLFNILNEEK